LPALIINRIAYEDTCMVVWNLCLRFFRLRAKDRYDRRRHTEYAGYRQIFLRGDERKRDGCTTGRSGKNGERQIQIHQGSRQDDQDVHIPQQHRLHRMGEAPYVQNWLAESDIPIPEQVELNRFREATREENIRIHDLTAECMKLLPKIRAKDSVAKQEFASIRQTVNSIHDEIILQKELLLMLDYPITDAGLEELRDAAKSCQAGKLKDKALVVSVYSKLTDEQRQSRLGEEITSLLSISSTVQEGDKIADVELKDIKGNIHHLSDYKGKYIILDFWSRYCGPCLDAFPLLKEIAEKYKEKIVVISLSVDPEAVWKETEVKESADNWLQLSDGLGMSGIAAHYGVHALPSFIYISPESTVLKAGQGYKFLSEDIRTFIKDK